MIKRYFVLQENRSSHYPHESRFGFGSERLEKIEDHGPETGPNTVADRGVCDSHTHQVSSWLALDMGFFPGKRGSRRFTGGCGALPLQVTLQRLRRCQGKEIVNVHRRYPIKFGIIDRCKINVKRLGKEFSSDRDWICWKSEAISFL